MPSTATSWSFRGSPSPAPYTENLMEEEPLFKTNTGNDAMNIASQLELNKSAGWRVERNDTLYPLPCRGDKALLAQPIECCHEAFCGANGYGVRPQRNLRPTR